MTTNQTIDGVLAPRELLESFATYVADSHNAIMRARAKELRALLDAPAVESDGVNWKAVANEQMGIIQALKVDNEKLTGDRARLSGELETLRPAYKSVLAQLDATQPQGEPVACATIRVEIIDRRLCATVARFDVDQLPVGSLTNVYAEQPAPVAAVPDGYCIMPRQLTAENGAKALLLGEFKLLVTKECPECCELEEPIEGCSICDGEGEYGQKHTIPWDQIKFIYSKAVSGLAVKAESAKSR